MHVSLSYPPDKQHVEINHIVVSFTGATNYTIPFRSNCGCGYLSEDTGLKEHPGLSANTIQTSALVATRVKTLSGRLDVTCLARQSIYVWSACFVFA